MWPFKCYNKAVLLLPIRKSVFSGLTLSNSALFQTYLTLCKEREKKHGYRLKWEMDALQSHKYFIVGILNMFVKNTV